MTEPSKWAMERATELVRGQHVAGHVSRSLMSHADVARALDAAHAEGEAKGRREALEEAASLCDASEARIMAKLRKLEKPNADLAGAAAVGGADTAEKLARRIRTLMDKEPSR